MELSDKTLGDYLEQWAITTPEHEFIVYPDRNLRFSYKQFNERVDAMAKGLVALGVTTGTHVGIWATNVPDWFTFLFATAKIGAVMVTVNTSYKQHELEFVVKHADIHTLCITEGVFDGNYVDMTYEMLPELKTQPRGEITSDRFPFLKNVVFVGQEKYRGMYNTAELLLLGLNDQRPTLLQELRAQFNCHDVVNMQYTSGTTGFPKGVMLSHHNIANNGYFTGEGMGFTAADKLCCCVPLFHCFGIVLATMNCLTHGCTMVIVERFDPLRVLAAVHQERCTALYGVPTMFIAELNHPMFKLFDLTSLRTGIMAGALCPIDLMRRVTQEMHITHITSVYGLTESSPGMTHTTLEDDFETRCTTVGKPYPFTEVAIINPETGELCADNEQGEVCCRGYLIMKGYYKDEQATKEAIDKNGWLHSGDLGIRDNNGCYHITGRIKDMIIRGGENIYPREIEEFLYKHPAVKDVQVAGIPSPKYGEEIGVFIILKENQEILPSEIQLFCKGKIARHKVPKYVFFVEHFPLTGSGKIQKFKLKDIGVELLRQEGVEII